MPISRSTMSLEQGGGIWRAQNGRGSDSRVAEALKIKVLDFGVTLWMTSLVIGTGASLFTLVSVPTHFREENADAMVSIKVRSSQRSS